MPLGYEYKRYFIILQEEDKGYEMTAGKIPTGYVKIEIKKNKVKAAGFIQNMKSDIRSQYKLVLLAPGKKVALEIGLFRMDGTGRGEFNAEFDSENVLGSNLPIDEFTGALVSSGSGTPLVGYTGRESIQWRDWYGKKKEEPSVEKRADEEIQQAERGVVELPPTEERKELEEDREAQEIVEIEETREVQKIDEVEETREADEVAEMEPVREAEERDEIEPAREEEMADIEETREEVETEPMHYSFHGGDIDSVVNQSRKPIHKKDEKESDNRVQRKLRNALRYMERFEGFYDQYGYRWYRIGHELPLLNDVVIPLNGAMMPLSYPYIAETGGSNIENCVFGVEFRDGDIRYVYIGLPGPYHPSCKACLEYKGFTGYKRTRDRRNGYWIMCIDIMKGRVCRI